MCFRNVKDGLAHPRLFSNISSETAEPIIAKLHEEHHKKVGTKVSINCPFQVTKMAARAQNYNAPLKLGNTLVKVMDFSIQKDAFRTYM